MKSEQEVLNSHKAKLEELRARRAKVEKKAEQLKLEDEQARELHQEEGKTLEAEMTAEHGVRGQKWDIVDAFPHGFIIVKLNERSRALHKAFTSVPQDKIAPEHLDALVTPHLMRPSADEFREYTARTPGIIWSVTKVVLELCEGGVKVFQGK